MRLSLANLAGAEKRASSQNGEDGVIAAIFAAIGTTNRFFVEFGVEGGAECNTAHLLTQGWRGLMMDADGVSRNRQARVFRAFITAENINDLLAKYGVPRAFDLLSIDIDGNDYWVWRALAYRPRVVVIEYNASVPPDLRRTIPYDPAFDWDLSEYFGASLRALAELGEQKGYALVYCETAGANAFFIARSELPPDYEPLPLEAVYRPPNIRFRPNLKHSINDLIDPEANPPFPVTIPLRESSAMELSTFDTVNRLKPCRYGQMLYNIHDRYVGRSLDLYGEFSEGEVEIFRQIVQPGHLVLDIGANIGCHTLFFARAVGLTGGVYAFEPQRLVYQMLCANMALNHVPNVRCLLAALGSEPGHLLVPQFDLNKENNLGGLGLGHFSFGEKVPVLTLDSLDLPRCDVIKLDVEGMEEEVLRGATQTIAKFRPVLYVENDREEKSASLIRYIDSLGYAMFWHYPPLYNPSNIAGNPENVFCSNTPQGLVQIVSANMLCVHRDLPMNVGGMAKVEVP